MSDTPGTTDDTFVHLVIVMRDDGEFHNASDRWGVPDALKDKLPIDVTNEEDDEFGLGVPVRIVTLSGRIDSDTLAKFRDEWSIDPEHAVPALGFLGCIDGSGPRLYPDERHAWGGEDFNVGGWTPILDVTLSIVGDGAKPA